MNTSKKRLTNSFGLSLFLHAFFIGGLYGFFLLASLQAPPVKEVIIMELADSPPPPPSQPVVAAKDSGTIAPKKGSAKSQAPKKGGDFDSLLAVAKSGVKIKNKGVIKPEKQESLTELARNMKNDLIKNNTSGQVSHSKLSGLFDAGKLSGAMQWDKVKLDTARTKSGDGPISDSDSNKISIQLGRYAVEFRDCYEKALLTDQNLAGYAKFFLTVANGGKVDHSQIDFSGQGSGNSQLVLKSCLGNVFKKIPFPNSVAGKTVSFGLHIKS